MEYFKGRIMEDMLGQMRTSAGVSALEGRMILENEKELKTALSRHLPQRFAKAWIEAYADSKSLRQYSDKDLREIVARPHHWEIIPDGTAGYGKAEVTAGGVDTDELHSKTMEARRVPGLYFVGEVVDVTGQLGGFNLQWAWASGYAAGQAV